VIERPAVDRAAREPGVRAKIAVSSNNSDIDPVGACVGMKGSRVQNVVQELRGEKIDIIPWHVDAAKFVCNALAPAEISRVIIDETNRSMEVVVPDDYLSIAIGKRGQNVRLASKLTGWHLDVQSESRYNEAMKSGYESLMALPDMGVSLADSLYEAGFFSVDEISIASVEDLTQIRDIGDDQARALISAARQAVLDAENAVEVDEKAVMGTGVEQVAASEQELPENAESIAGQDDPMPEEEDTEDRDPVSETPAETEKDSEPKE